MGRKKGKQCGYFHSKKLNAEHHRNLYDNALEANSFRNPVSSGSLGNGFGYKSSTILGGSGRWDTNGRSCNGDKWSSIFAHRSSEKSTTPSRHNQSATRGLAHLRNLLEDRRTEDRFHERQFRLAVQRSRARDFHYGNTTGGEGVDGSVSGMNQPNQGNPKASTYEPGWMISQSDQIDALDKQQHSPGRVPSLQILSAKSLGPLLPMYVAACGHDVIGECLKSASPTVLAQLSISLAKSSMEYEDEESIMYATTDGVTKALVYSGVATGLVLKGAPLVQSHYFRSKECKGIEENDIIDTRWLSDEGLLALCPRLLPQALSSDAYNDDWETLDVDLDLTRRMAGCFHLKRLELVDIPLCSESMQGGISLEALRHVLQSCPGITHLGLSGCFYNCTDMISRKTTEDVIIFLCGTNSTSSTPAKSNTNTASHYDNNYEYASDHNMCDIKGVHQLVPDLQVLDISRCCWVTPTMLLRFLLHCRGWTNSNCKAEKEQNSEAFGCIRSQQLLSVGVMDCNNLSPADIITIEEYINHTLFSRVKLIKSINRE